MKPLKTFIANIVAKIRNRKNRIFYSILLILQYAIIGFLAYFFDRILEVLTIIPLFFIFRSKYTKQFHAKSLFLCGCYTLIVFFIISIISTSKEISILASIFLTYFLTTISYYVRDYLDIIFLRGKNVSSRNKILKILDHNIDEEYIENFRIKNGMNSKMADTIYLFLNNKGEDVADILEISHRTVCRRIKEFIAKGETI